MNNLNQSTRIKKVPVQTPQVTFEEWASLIKDYFPELAFPAEVVMSIVAQLLITDITNPFAIVLVDKPSSGKTITINFFDGIPELTYSSDKFTPASFLSHAASVKREDLESIDLLPRIRHKAFLIRDLATMFAKKEDDLNDSLGTLTRVLDGEGLSADTGLHGQRKYVGDYSFMMVAASTPIQPRVWRMMSNLGSRLFFLRMKSVEKTEEELAEQITYKTYKEKEKLIQKKTKEFLYSLWNKYPEGIEWNRRSDLITTKHAIVRIAKLLSRLRGTINVSKAEYGSSEDLEFSRPIIENPDRITQLLYNLARGHALSQGRDKIDNSDLKVVFEVALDSAPENRSDLLHHLLQNKGVMKTSQIEKALKISKPSAIKEMRILDKLGICFLTKYDGDSQRDYELHLRIKPEFEWFVSEEADALRGLASTEQDSEDLFNKQD